ncbi:MAG: biopolymer transporter ExbD [SAR324 cluster bacterium]|jgi:biopolymer transport protein ExbD|nr:biopolymer transporter ExbD [SAR324 cluster bacterium]RZO46974.1 MAG: biopolymer transporter ExbD [Pseudomonadota bacterium]HAF89449.1 biopolymer transporter ExbD [Deltaproteobacteria bacterium]MDP6320625.1 biopolymer transporter ExbD [SAR324 cluster bacterium]MEC9360430.1 biopolymer transporter ExbD [SAR324 cluster bacterium]|tara:strand:+ start:1200 stop:1637 length:438 start_codon:yes stop_codon:yes gene_type:complete
MGGSSDQNEPLSEINVTPFVDVLLVLLIIFMVTAPIVNHVIQVDLPEDSYNQDKMKPMQKPLRVVIDKSGVLYLANTRIGDSNEEMTQRVLEDKIKQWTKGQKQPWLVDVEADEKVDYGSIVPVIARLKELKVSMNLVIRPKSKK